MTVYKIGIYLFLNLLHMKRSYLLITLISCANAMAQFGGLDPSFGNEGKVYSNFSGADRISDFVILPNGKIVAGGYARTSGISNNNDFMVCRYHPDGTLDTTFGNNGKTIIDYNNAINNLTSICILQDGKILAAGNVFTNPPAASNFLFMRFNADGSHDTNFGTNGFVVSNFPTHNEIVLSLKELPDGDILAMGSTTVNSDKQFVIARYDSATMALDNNFNGTGYYISDSGPGNSSFAFNMLVLPDNKILVAGHKFLLGNALDYAVWKFNENGTPDTSFGTNGIVTNDFYGLGDLGFDLATFPDGKILLSGCVQDWDNRLHTALIRYNANGTLDQSFGANGKVIPNIPLIENVVQSHLCVRNNGKLALTFTFDNAPPSINTDIGLIFLNADGTPDTIFGSNGDGIVTTNFSTASLPYGIAEQSDGKIVIAGYTVNPSDSILARYLVPSLGTVNHDHDLPIQIYPNPFHDHITIGFDSETPETVSFTLFDNRGRTINTNLSNAAIEANAQAISINDLGSLSQGIYFLKVQTETTTKTYKIIKS